MTQGQKLDSIEERLKQHARSFEGLLSLIPAKHYYEQDNSDQWLRKKQTKAEARAAKMAKLDPDNHKSAQDVMNEQQAEFRKRKREEAAQLGDEGSPGSSTAHHHDSTQQNRKKRKLKDSKTSKNEDGLQEQDGGDQEVKPPKSSSSAAANAEKRRRHRENKRLRNERLREAKQAKKAKQKQKTSDGSSEKKKQETKAESSNLSEISLQILDSVGHSKNELGNDSDSASDSSLPSESITSDFDAPLNLSASSSITSLPPQSPDQASATAKDAPPGPSQEVKPSNTDPEELKRRLQARLDEFRTARKANDQQTLPRSRQELIDSRRHKEELRKAQKKEMRRKQKEEEAQERDEILARGSPLLSPASPSSARSEGLNYAFGNVQFSDGQKLSADLSGLIQPRKTPKGPSDPATALRAAQNKDSRLAALDEGKRANIAEKDSWVNARKRAQGERIRDDSNLLKKTLKRKQSQKKKSEKEWKERIEGVKKREAIKQRKREANLKQRRDEKGGRGKKGKGAKARPGFEGSFRAKASSGKN